MKAISIRQPWASLITQGIKDIENRTWRTNYHGPLLIHAGKAFDPTFKKHPVLLIRNLKAAFSLDLHTYHDLFDLANYPRGGIVGIASITACVTAHDSPWFEGPYGFILDNARPLPFKPYKGLLGIFNTLLTPSSFNQETTPAAYDNIPAYSGQLRRTEAPK